MRRWPVLALGVILVVAACGGDASAAPTVTRTAVVATLPATTAAPATTAPATRAPASSASVTAAPASTSSATPSATGLQLSALAARGKTVYETAGEVGCQDCHGPAAKGGLLKNGQSAPDIRGGTYQKTQDALRGGVPTMSFIKLTTAELEAVIAYLEYLNSLP